MVYLEMNSTVNANSVMTLHAPDIKPLAADTVRPCAMHSHRALINPRTELRMHNSLHGYKRAHKQNPRQLSVTKRIHLYQGYQKNRPSQQLFKAFIVLILDRHMFRPSLAIIKWNTQYNII
jgi:hypothetical protein